MPMSAAAGCARSSSPARASGATGARSPPTSDPHALTPVIGSSICLIEDGRFYYRGRDAVRLSDTATLEEIAKLLWLDQAGAELTDKYGVIRSATSASAARLIE